MKTRINIALFILATSFTVVACVENDPQPVKSGAGGYPNSTTVPHRPIR